MFVAFEMQKPVDKKIADRVRRRGLGQMSISPECFERGNDKTLDTLSLCFVLSVIARICAGAMSASERSYPLPSTVSFIERKGTRGDSPRVLLLREKLAPMWEIEK